jgi:hypothetical protein
MSRRDLRQPDFAILLLLAWGLAAAQLVFHEWHVVARVMTDTDDALRLVQVRAFLDGRGWFDLHEPRLGPPAGYDSHWSRLVDAGLAGLFLLLRVAVDTAHAELLMRIVWPLLWLVPATAAAAAISWRIGGRDAALVLLVLVAVGLPALNQFAPGRIDHHNVQITLAVSALAAAAWADRPHIAAAGGVLAGLAVAVGLESLPFLVVAGAVPALRFCIDRAGAPALRAYGLGLAAATLAGFAATVAPSQWGRTACDMLAINMMEPMVAAGLGLVAAGAWFASPRASVRWAAVAAVAAIAAATFVSLEPRCLGGPFVMMAPALRGLWLAHVREMQPLWQFVHQDPAFAVAISAFPLAGLVATVALARRATRRRNPGFLAVSAAFMIAVGMTMTAVKSCNYATWLAMPLVAGATPLLFTRFHVQTAAARAFIAIMLTPAVLSAGAVAAVQAAGAGSKPDNNNESGCFESKSYAQLAHLPKGVIAIDIDYGPYVLALTPHAALGAPYHRLSEGILAVHGLFAAPADEARRIVDLHGIDYIVSCGSSPPNILSVEERRHGLWAALAAGALPDWLEKMPAGADDVFTVYRVYPPGRGPAG